MQYHRSLESNVVTNEVDNTFCGGVPLNTTFAGLLDAVWITSRSSLAEPPLVRYNAAKAVSAGLCWFTYQLQVLIVSHRLSKRNRLVLNHLDTLLFLVISPPLYTRYTLSLRSFSILSLQALIVVYRSIIIRPSFHACMYLIQPFRKTQNSSRAIPSHPIL